LIRNIIFGKTKSKNLMDLLEKLKKLVHENLADENFGVGELAEQAGMSRSTLLRKMQKESDLSAGQFIKKVRLEKAKEFLKEGQPTISEVSYQVGFNSTSYFIKCFKEEYGLSPGEFQKDKNAINPENFEEVPEKDSSIKRKVLYLSILVLVVTISLFWWTREEEMLELDKSIAVLPFKNNSQDYSNIYVVNGLMDAVLNNLQKIKDLKVVSRQSVEQFRNSEKSIQEIANELGVSYLVEGSGQKIGDRILLNVQLIDGKNDRQIWSEAYEKDLEDVFTMQRDIAEIIVNQVNARITPEELKRLEEIPTQDMVAYDYFLQGLQFLSDPSGKGLEPSISFFDKAIERDPEFSRAYAASAMAYYYMDIFQAEKIHAEQLNYNAEKAFLLQPQLPQALVAKAFSYMVKREYETAVTYLEKALEYHPNSAFVIKYLADFYANYIPNSPKYLEYSLKGLQLDKSSMDSVSLSYMYLHISNAFLQTGFLNQALLNINQSLDYNENNIYSKYVKAYVYYAQNRDLIKTNRKLLEIYSLDTTRIDVIQEVAKTFYNLKDFKNAWVFYQKLLRHREEQNISLFMHEDIKIAWTCKQLGLKEKESKLLEEYFQYTEFDQSIYKPLLKSAYYAYINDTVQALDYFSAFSESDDYHFWIFFLGGEPHLESISNTREFKEIMKKLEDKFWERHEKIKQQLQSEGLI
jgi:TolB-like protein/AraC-like DNA-binding protein/Tfp pilus assembly protein PilF